MDAMKEQRDCEPKRYQELIDHLRSAEVSPAKLANQLASLRNLNRMHDKRRTLMHEVFANPACHSVEVIQLLVNAGVTMNPKHNHPSLLLMYLKHCKAVDVDLLAKIIEWGANPNAKTCLTNPVY